MLYVYIIHNNTVCRCISHKIHNNTVCRCISHKIHNRMFHTAVNRVARVLHNSRQPQCISRRTIQFLLDVNIVGQCRTLVSCTEPSVCTKIWRILGSVDKLLISRQRLYFELLVGCLRILIISSYVTASALFFMPFKVIR